LEKFLQYPQIFGQVFEIYDKTGNSEIGFNKIPSDFSQKIELEGFIMRNKKLTTILLTLSFTLSMVGGALAEVAPVTDPATQPAPVTQPTTPPVTDPTTPPTTPPATDPAPVPEAEKTYPGNVKAIDLAGKKLTVINSNKKDTKEFIFDEKTKFIYKGKEITPDKLTVASKIVVNYQMADKTAKIISVNIAQLEVKKVVKAPVKKPAKKPVKKVVKKVIKVVVIKK
jgi:hypothetical protein